MRVVSDTTDTFVLHKTRTADEPCEERVRGLRPEDRVTRPGPVFAWCSWIVRFDEAPAWEILQVGCASARSFVCVAIDP